MEIDSVEVTQDFEPDNELATALEKYSEKMEVELIKGQSLQHSFSNFSSIFLNPNIFFQFEF